ncbi:MAG: transposase [Prevotella sp.]|nr:transposase [Prevotella sp.]
MLFLLPVFLPNITRIACLQHIKRKFIDCMDAELEAKEMVKLIKKLYHEDHKHKIGENSWTVEDNFKWRQQYATAILADIRDKLDEIQKRPDLNWVTELTKTLRKVS